MYWIVQWPRIADSTAWNYVCASRTSHHSMETVPVTQMLRFLGVLDSGRCLQTKSLTDFIKIHSVLFAFVKLWKATVTCIMSVCLEWLSSKFVFFMKFLGGKSEKIQLSLKSDKNNGYFTWRPTYIFDHISLIST